MGDRKMKFEESRRKFQQEERRTPRKMTEARRGKMTPTRA
jgi:hypothetical protein